ncbi:carbon-nitrogen hydrolase family protein [Bacillus sp. 1NLA3E]|uniref:carbon-nitrogen hydrolase family protein n=1 Tax=Bacillus sp. 1NLA3E TaxID=666686 RepID=UPI000247F1DF|nr:carbon-nitrogen hydrolase family protein [Bacillus sp. 1NLA3E]AGK55340.1 nitrilase/cyanide hydratase and apolipoprotein N- acyltransferase [Bacillus sp. 1NLA3E]
MLDKLKVSMIQMQVTNQVEENVNKAIELIIEAGKSDPDVIILPENFHMMGRKDEFFETAETLDGPTLTRLRELAKELGTYIVAGTMRLRFPETEKLKNICCVINPEGEIQDMYNKIHTFNAQVGGRTYSGRKLEEAGDEIVVTSIKGIPVGLSVCFDLRFPEMFRILALKGAKVILVPAIFMLHTGKDHWEVLLRARAIENQVYIVAPATYGTFPPHNEWSYGRSMVVDPWGVVVAQASDKTGVITVDLDLDWLEDVRKRVPTLSQRRPDVYDWEELDK